MIPSSNLEDGIRNLQVAPKQAAGPANSSSSGPRRQPAPLEEQTPREKRKIAESLSRESSVDSLAEFKADRVAEGDPSARSAILPAASKTPQQTDLPPMASPSPVNDPAAAVTSVAALAPLASSWLTRDDERKLLASLPQDLAALTRRREEEQAERARVHQAVVAAFAKRNAGLTVSPANAPPDVTSLAPCPTSFLTRADELQLLAGLPRDLAALTLQREKEQAERARVNRAVVAAFEAQRAKDEQKRLAANAATREGKFKQKQKLEDEKEKAKTGDPEALAYVAEADTNVKLAEAKEKAKTGDPKAIAFLAKAEEQRLRKIAADQSNKLKHKAELAQAKETSKTGDAAAVAIVEQTEERKVEVASYDRNWRADTK